MSIRRTSTQAENYSALRELLIDAAMTSQRPWRNADNPLDVNDDGEVEPLDALNIINKLNAEGPHELPPPQAGDPPMRYYDCNGDGEVGPIDASERHQSLERAQRRSERRRGRVARRPSRLASGSAGCLRGAGSQSECDGRACRPNTTACDGKQSDLAPSRAAPAEDRDTVWPVAASSRSEADPPRQPCPSRTRWSRRIGGWPSARPTNRFWTTLDGQAVRDL